MPRSAAREEELMYADASSPLAEAACAAGSGLLARSPDVHRASVPLGPGDSSGVAVQSPLRVIVFGSRNWTHYGYIQDRILCLPDGTTIVHGACRTGADQIADDVARARGFAVEQHHAAWYPNGYTPGRRPDYSAGPRRNKHMAQLGASLAIGFRSPGKSNGTDNMWAECMLAGIQVERHGWDWPARW